MTIQLAATAKAINVNAPIDFDDPAVIPDSLTEAWVGVDLSLLGATTSDSIFDVGSDMPVDRLNFPRLACAVKAALGGGIDFVSLGSTFFSRSDLHVRDGSLDGAKTAAKLAEISTGGVCVEVPAAAHSINQAVDLIAAQDEGWAGITVAVDASTDFASILPAAKNARITGVEITAIVAAETVSAEFAQNVAEFADIVRLRVTDPHNARGIRFAIRAAADAKSRSIPVIADLGIVISASMQAAEERAVLISEMTGTEIFAGLPSAVGTVYDVADAIESWVGLGAADGVLLVPASLPTDLASILRGVLPLLKARTVID